MKKYNKVGVLGISTLMILSNLCFASALTSPTTNQKQIKGDLLVMTIASHHGHDECCRKPRLKESVEQLQQSGTFTDKDVQNIDAFMKKEREAVKSEIQDKIYKEECSKIDKMVSEKVISKDQGDQLKAVVKQNMQNCN